MCVTYSIDISGINGISNSSLVVLDVGVTVTEFTIKVVALGVIEVVPEEINSARSAREVESVGVTHGRCVTSLDRLLVIVVLNIAKAVGKTFQVVTGDQLLIEEVELFSAVVAVDLELFGVEPEWTVQVVVVVICVDSYIFGEVGERLLRVHVQVPSGVVGLDVVGYEWIQYLVGLFLKISEL